MARLAAVVASALVATALAQDKTRLGQSAFHFPARLAALDEGCFPKVIQAKSSVTLQTDFAETKAKIEAQMKAGRDDIETKQKTMESDMEKKMDNLALLANTQLKELEDELSQTEEALVGYVNTQVADLTSQVANALELYEKAKTMANDTANHKWTRNYELVAVAKVPPGTQNNHEGRIMYRVQYNPNHPGHWWPDKRELKDACKHLGEDLEAADGIDRDMKPACNHDHGFNDHYCGSESVMLRGSYLSHCGCGGNPRNRECLGMTNQFLRGAVTWSQHWSSNGNMLRHDGRDCHHEWLSAHGTHAEKAEYTICTSDNDNYKL